MTEVRARYDVIVRTFNSASTLPAALASLAQQTVPVSVIVVDSGSVDGTVELARSEGCHVIELAADSFTFGRALNAGADRASGDVTFALSSHSVAPSPLWVEDSLRHYEDPRVVATGGMSVDAFGAPLLEAVEQDLPLALRHPRWGLSNTGSSWRMKTFADVRFREDLEACEDKEWAFRALALGGIIMIDPRLAIESSHRRKQGINRYFNRVRRENRALMRCQVLPPVSDLDIARAWWRGSISPSAGSRGFTSVSRLVDHLAMSAAQHDLRAESRR